MAAKQHASYTVAGIAAAVLVVLVIIIVPTVFMPRCLVCLLLAYTSTLALSLAITIHVPALRLEAQSPSATLALMIILILALCEVLYSLYADHLIQEALLGKATMGPVGLVRLISDTVGIASPLAYRCGLFGINAIPLIIDLLVFLPIIGAASIRRGGFSKRPMAMMLAYAALIACTATIVLLMLGSFAPGTIVRLIVHEENDLLLIPGIALVAYPMVYVILRKGNLWQWTLAAYISLLTLSLTEDATISLIWILATHTPTTMGGVGLFDSLVPTPIALTAVLVIALAISRNYYLVKLPWPTAKPRPAK